ncbi:hypothetical protein CEXT_46101, partial [Caerostris extrusa]
KATINTNYEINTLCISQSQQNTEVYEKVFSFCLALLDKPLAKGRKSVSGTLPNLVDGTVSLS